MRHLSAEELVDLAEGARAESSAPHLAACARCRRQLDELRSMISSLSEERVPEPSPLFWDHLQQRVNEAVASEAALRSGWWTSLVRARVLVPLGALAAIALAVAFRVDSRVTMPPMPDGPVQVASTAPDAGGPSPSSRLELLNDSLSDDDPSLQLVADLTATMDWNKAGEAGLALEGSAEHAVTHLSTPELVELQRLLQQELGRTAP